MTEAAGDPPDVVRFHLGTVGFREMVAKVDAVLKARSTAWFPFLPDDERPFFALRPTRGSIQVIDGGGQHIGTFADTAAAMIHGWARAGR